MGPKAHSAHGCSFFVFLFLTHPGAHQALHGPSGLLISDQGFHGPSGLFWLIRAFMAHHLALLSRPISSLMAFMALEGFYKPSPGPLQHSLLLLPIRAPSRPLCPIRAPSELSRPGPSGLHQGFCTPSWFHEGFQVPSRLLWPITAFVPRQGFCGPLGLRQIISVDSNAKPAFFHKQASRQAGLTKGDWCHSS